MEMAAGYILIWRLYWGEIASKFSQVVGRIPFLMAVGFNAACFFKASSAESLVCVCVFVAQQSFFFFFKSFHLIHSSTPRIISPIIKSESFGWALYPLGWQLLKGKREHQKIMCWRGCGETGNLMHPWCECKMVQPLGKIVQRFLEKLNRELLYG